VATPSLAKEARSVIGPTLASLGYEEEPAQSPLATRWTRQLDNHRHVDFRLLRHHRPWLVDWNGNSFSSAFSLHPPPPKFSNAFDGVVWFLVTSEERDAMRQIHDAVIARLPTPTIADGLLASEVDGVIREHQILTRSWLPTQEVKIRYRTIDDLRAWLSLLRELLPTLEARTLARLQRLRTDA
jgi:hypothetical protein